MSTPLYQRSTQQAERTFLINTSIALLSAGFVFFVSENQPITGLILALAAWHIVRRVIKGPPVGIAMLEIADGFLYLRNPNAKPPRTDRIALEKLHSIGLVGEEHLRYFDCKLRTGEVDRIGPFERGQGEIVIAEWFYRNLPDTPFHVDPSASPMHRMATRPTGM